MHGARAGNGRGKSERSGCGEGGCRPQVSFSNSKEWLARIRPAIFLRAMEWASPLFLRERIQLVRRQFGFEVLRQILHPAVVHNWDWKHAFSAHAGVADDLVVGFG